MVTLFLRQGETGKQVLLSFPVTTPAEKEDVTATLETLKSMSKTVTIQGAASEVMNLGLYLSGVDLAAEGEQERINRLAERLEHIETSSVVVFTVADGAIVNYSVAYADSLRENLAESQVTLAKRVFEEKNVEVMNSVSTGRTEPEYDIVSDEFYYYYNFEDDTLYHVSSVVYAVFGTNACSGAETRTFVKKF